MALALLGIDCVKAACQWLSCDFEGAKETCDNFTKRCVGVSQLRSALEAISGDRDAALKTQKEFVCNAVGCIDSKPGFGHVKALFHYGFRDKEGGDRIMKSASRPVGVMAGGLAGMVVGGPVGAVAGGISGGVVMDSLSYTIDSKINGEGKKSGVLQKLDDLQENPKDPGIWIDTIQLIFEDGASGHKHGKKYAKDPKKMKNSEVKKEEQKKSKNKQKCSKKKQKDSNDEQNNPNQKEDDTEETQKDSKSDQSDQIQKQYDSNETRKDSNNEQNNLDLKQDITCITNEKLKDSKGEQNNLIQKQDNTKETSRDSKSEQKNPNRKQVDTKETSKDSKSEPKNPNHKQVNTKETPKDSKSEQNNPNQKRDNTKEKQDCSKNKQDSLFDIQFTDLFRENVAEDNGSVQTVSNPDFQENYTCKISYEISEQYKMTADELQYEGMGLLVCVLTHSR